MRLVALYDIRNAELDALQCPDYLFRVREVRVTNSAMEKIKLPFFVRSVDTVAEILDDLFRNIWDNFADE